MLLSQTQTFAVDPVKDITCPCTGICRGKEYSITWTLLDLKPNTHSIKSPMFCIGDDDKLRAYVEVYINFNARGDLLTMSPYLNFKPRLESPFEAKLTFELARPGVYGPTFRGDLGAATLENKDMIIEAKTFKENCGWGFEKMANYNVSNGSRQLIVKCTICMIVKDSTAKVVSTAETCRELLLANDMQSLLESGRCSDVVLVVKDTEYKAHRGILAARSPVFAAMLDAGMAESNTGVINITDMEPNVVQAMLSYIYSDKVETLDEMAVELLVASDKYELYGLKAQCETHLSANLTVENSSRILRIADLHRANYLKDLAAKFIAKNMIEVKTTEGWKSLKKTSLLLIVETIAEGIEKCS